MNKIKKVIEESRKEFSEFMSEGYSGGKSGLRCSTCDHKYSGEPNIVQLCPRCKATETISNVLTAIEEEVEGMKKYEAIEKCSPYDSCSNNCKCYEDVRNETLSNIQELLKQAKEK